MAEMMAAELRKLAEDKTFGGANDFYEYVVKHKKEIVVLIEQQAQEIERLNKSLQFEQNYLSRVGTHGPDCYKWGPGHWDCAVQEIERLQAENEGLKCCGNCKHQTYDGMDYGCEVVLKNYHQNKCDKWHGVK